MSLVQSLEPKWYFIYITSTHARPEDDPAGEQNWASIVCEWFTGLKYFGVLLRYILWFFYFHIYFFDQMVGCI